MPNSNSRGRIYDLHIHLDTHSPVRFSPSDYYVALLELGIAAAGFVMHDAVPAYEPLEGIAAYFGIECTIPRTGARRRKADYSLAHAASGHDLADLVGDMVRERIDILAHPFAQGTLCSDWGYLLDMMSEHTIAIEYNASYGGPAWIYERADANGVQITFGSDAHAPDQLSIDMPPFVTPISELPFAAHRV